MEIITCDPDAGPACPMPHNVWLGASFRLGAPQPVTDPYPHLCQGPNSVGFPARDCPPCAAADRPPMPMREPMVVPRPAPAISVPAPARPPRIPDPNIPDGWYAVARGEKQFFYRLKRLSPLDLGCQEQISEGYISPRHPRVEIFALILRDVERAGLNYAEWLGRCRRCGMALTDNLGNPYLIRGYGPCCGKKVAVAEALS